MAENSPNLGEKAISKIAEIQIADQLDETESLDVDIRTDPAKIVQGEVDSVEISGKGLVLKQDLRMENLEVKTDSVAINPLSAVFGNIELTRPTTAEAHIVLTEADLNRALTSDFLQSKLQGLQMEMQGQKMTVDVQEARIKLPGNNQFEIKADFLLREQTKVQNVSAIAVPKIEENGHRISLEILSVEGHNLTSELITAILDQLTNLLDLRNFNLPGISLKMHQLDAQKGQLLIQAKTQIEQIPS